MPAAVEPELEPSYYCVKRDRQLGIRHFHVCQTDAQHGDRVDWLHQPRDLAHAGPEGLDADALAVTPGFGYGFVLFPFLLDWGDCIPKPRRKMFDVTILKGWPRHQDRAAAYTVSQRFLDPRDNCTPPLTLHLITARPFAGYHWDPYALREWLDAVDSTDCAHAQPFDLDPAAGLAAAQAWIAFARDEWNRRTGERFPYGVADLIDFWTPSAVHAVIPDDLIPGPPQLPPS